MFENAHAIVGIIELTSAPEQSAAEVDDSRLDCLLASLVSHESLADASHLTPACPKAMGWQRVGGDSVYDGRASVTADLGALVDELEREYAQICDVLDS